MTDEARTERSQTAEVATSGMSPTSRARTLATAFLLLCTVALVLASTAHATFLPPNAADQYVALRSYAMPFDIDTDQYHVARSFAFDSGGSLWVAEYLSRNEDEISSLAVYTGDSTQPLASYPLGNRNISSCEFGPDGFLYLADLGNGGVIEKFDTVSQSVVETISVEGFSLPRDIHLDGSGTIFVTDWLSNEVARVDGATGATTKFSAIELGLLTIQAIDVDVSGNLIVGGDALLAQRVVRCTTLGTVLGSIDVSSLGQAPMSDLYVDVFGTTYVLGSGGFGRIASNGTSMGVYPDPAEGTLTAPRKLIIDNSGYAWANSNPEDGVQINDIQRYTFVEGVSDATPPTTSSDAPSGWVKGPVTVSFTANDNAGGSGVAATYYSLDGSLPSQLVTSPVSIASEGTTNLRYLSVDNAGNRESATSKSVRIDNMAPVSSAIVQPVYYGAVHIDLNAMDALSGVRETYWRMNGGAWTMGSSVGTTAGQLGGFGLDWYSVDNAGNAEFPYQSAYFEAFNRYEQSAQEIDYRGTWTNESGGNWSGGTYARSSSPAAAAYVTFSGKIIDVYSPKGPNLGKVRLRLDAGAWSAPIDLYAASASSEKLARYTAAGTGTHVLAIESLNDKNPLSSGTGIGLDAVDVDGTLLIDTTPPTTTSNADSDWYSATRKITLTALDSSFVAETLYRVGATGVMQSYTAPFAVPANGTSVAIEYRSVDGRGNAETTRSVTVKVDSTPPISTTDAQASYVDSCTVNLSATDNLSGVSKRQYRLDGGVWTDGASVAITGYGSHTLRYRAVDVAGNVEAEKTAAIQISYPTETYTYLTGPPELNWNGQWSVWNTDAKRTYTSTTNNYVYGYGQVTRVQIWAYKSLSAGVARISLDGATTFVDLYAATTTLALVYDSGPIADGNHYLAYGWSGYLNEHATSTRVNVHSVVVQGRFGSPVDDVLPPSTTSNIPSDWTAAPFQVSLTESDNMGTGPSFYDVSATATDTPDATTLYEGQFTVAQEGVSNVSYYSIDQVGNREPIKTQQLRLDSSPPTTTSDAVADYTNQAIINLSASDAYSGVAGTRYRVDSGTWTTGTVVTVPGATPATHTLEWYSIDRAGNTEITHRASFTVLRRFEDENATAIEQEGLESWASRVNPLYSAGLMREAFAAGALAGTFSGDRFDLISTTRPDYGIARVVIDDAYSGTSDQYSPTPAYRQRVYSRSGLGQGIHTFRVEWTGTSNALSTGTNINVDAFELVGALIADVEPPVSALEPSDDSWRTTPETVTITATDNGVVSPVVRYRINGGDIELYSDPFEVSAEGTTSIEYWATDGVGNAEIPRTALVRIDRVAPSVATSAPATWVRGPITATLSASDTGCGVATLRYSTNGSAPSIPYTDGGIAVSAEGTTTVRYQATDNLGNASAIGSFTVRLDRTLPTSSDNAPTTWVKGPQLVTLNAADALSGVAAIHYSLNGATWGTYSAPVSIAGEGTHSLRFHSHDFAGNEGTAHTATVRIDDTVPVSSHDAPTGWQNSNVTVHLTATDALSGVDATYYSLDGTAPSTVATAGTGVSTEGTTTLGYFSIDKAGNAETAKSVVLKIDKSAPTTTDDAPGTWAGAPVTVHLSASDAISGVNHTRFAVNGSSAAEYSMTGVTVAAEGVNTITYASQDVAGTWETTKTATARIDYTAPVTTAAIAASYSETAVITFMPTDAGSGVAQTVWRLDDGEWTSGTVATTAIAGAHRVEWYSVDQLGHTEAAKSATFSVVKRFDQSNAAFSWKGPWTVYSNANHYQGSYRYANTSGATAYVGFSGTGFSWITQKAPDFGIAQMSVDGGAPVDVDLYASGYFFKQTVRTVTGLTNGPHLVRISWTGRKNASSTNTKIGVDALDVVGTISPDTASPVTTISADGAWSKTSVPVSLSATDISTWVAYTYYRIGSTTTAYTAPFSVSTEGTTTVEYWSVDGAGNVEERKTFDIRVDTTAPVTGDDAPSSWVKGPVSLQLDAEDAASGVTTTYYSTDGGEPDLTYSGPVTISAEGTTTVRYRSVDAAGNTESTKTTTVRIDDTAPSSSDDAPSGWVGGTQHVTIASLDPMSGHDSTVYQLDGSAATYDGPITVTGEGVHTLTYAAKDAVGNVESTRSATIRIDDTAPSTTSDALPSYVETATVSLNSVDALSGVVSTQFRLDGGTWTNGTSVTVAQGGPHTLLFRSTDAVGNTEAAKSATFNVVKRFDQSNAAFSWKGPWTVYSNANHYQGSYRYANTSGATAYVGFSGTGFSWITQKAPDFGIAQMSVDGGAPVDVDLYASGYFFKQTVRTVTGLTNGPHLVRISWTGRKNASSTNTKIGVDALDVVGTISPDTASPVTTISADGAWSKTSVPVSLSATDISTWVAYTYYRIGSTTTAYTAPFSVSTEGTTTVEYWSVDGAGNVEERKTFDIRVDTTAPVTGDDAPSSWVKGPVSLQLDAEDAASGVTTTYYSTDGGEPDLTYSGPVTISAEGTTTVRYRSVDAAGNTESTKTTTVRIDDTAPSSSDDAPSGWVGGTQHVTIASLDPMSGHDSTVYQLDGSAATYDGPITVTGEGVHTLTYAAKDAVGNVESTRSATIRIDDTAPSTTSDALAGWMAGPVVLRLTSSDAASGVDSVFYSLDGSTPSIPYVAPLVITGQGVNTVRFAAVDVKGNVENGKSTTVSIDSVAPVTTDNALPGWIRSTHSITLSATDEHSGVAGTVYSVNGGVPVPYVRPITVSAEGTAVLQYQSQDLAGNTEPTKAVTLRVDDSPPHTKANVVPSYLGSAAITLSPSDALSGVASTEWRLDGSAWVDGLSPFTDIGGPHTLEWRSIDAAGNIEDTNSSTFSVSRRLDNTDPAFGYRGAWSTLVSGSRYGGSYNYTSSPGATFYVAFEGTAFDLVASKLPSAGIARVTVDGAEPALVDLYSAGFLHQSKVLSQSGLANITHTLKVEFTGTKNPASTGTQVNFDAIDVAGHVLPAWPAFDTQAPLTGSNLDEIWRSSPLTMTLTATDDLSGVDGTHYRLGEDSVRDYLDPVGITTEGTTIVEFWSTDKAGNAETRVTKHVRIDSQPPSVGTDARTSYDGTATIAILASDSNSGLARTEYRVDGGAWVQGGTATVMTGGTHTLDARGTDNAGNTSRTVSSEFSVRRRFEQTDARLGWTGSWTTYNSPSRSGGSYAYTSSVAATAHIVFTGSSIDLVSSKLPSAGIMRVSVDSSTPVDVDLYSPGYAHQQKVFSVAGLGAGQHTIRVYASGAKNPASSGTQINLDAVDGTAELTQWTHRFEQTDSRLAIEGMWLTSNSPAHSAGSYAYSYAPGAAVNIAFTGTAISWVAPKGTIYGIAEVSIDGGAVETVDLYANRYAANQTVWSHSGLPAGLHTVRILVTGTKNASATGSNIGFDAMDVAGSLSQASAPIAPGSLFEQTSALLAYEGTWVNASSSTHSAGDYRYTFAPGAALNAHFTGTDITWVAPKGKMYGIAEVSIDNGPPSNVDLYSGTFLPQSQVWSARGLAPGAHTLRIVFTGSKNPAASANYIGVDALRIVGTLNPATPPSTTVRSEEDSSAVSYSGPWVRSASANYSSGAYRYSASASATAEFAFVGTGVRWIAPMGVNYGIATVSIDAGSPTIVDLFADKYVSQALAWQTAGLGPGPHTVRVTVTGNRSASATAANVGLDAFDVIP